MTDPSSHSSAHGTRLSNSEWLTVIESHCYLIKAILFDESSPIYFPSVGTYCTVRTSGTLRIVRIGATFLDNNVNPSLLSLNIAFKRKRLSTFANNKERQVSGRLLLLHLAPCILHLSSFIFHLSSFILHLASCILHLAPCILHCLLYCTKTLIT